MKGLKEALKDREERHSRVDRRDLSEEAIEQNSRVFAKIEKGSRVKIDCYCAFHDVRKEGRITEISLPFQYLKLDGEKIFFDDIYKISITEW